MVSFPHVSPQKPCSHLSLPPYVQISKLGNLNLLQNVHKSIPLIVYDTRALAVKAFSLKSGVTYIPCPNRLFQRFIVLRDLIFSQWSWWRFKSSGTWQRMNWYINTLFRKSMLPLSRSSGQRWRCLWTFLFSNVPTFATSRLQEIVAAKGGTTWARNGRWILPENSRLPRNIQGSFTCRKSTTWDRRLYFPSEERGAEDFFALKNLSASVGFEPANLGTKCQHATSRPPKTLIIRLQVKHNNVTEFLKYNQMWNCKINNI